jgi:D-glycero-alpha-D-manno-heptose-7-phosphate kinase
MIVAKAPFRLPLGGGGTDLPQYYSRFGAHLITSSIDKYMYVFINKPSIPDKFRLHYSQIETTDDVSAIKHDIIREALIYYNITHPIEITSMADIGAGTGMGSSSAFTVALLAGLNTFYGLGLSVSQIAHDACVVEIEKVGSPIGKQDQYASAVGGINRMTIDRDGRVEMQDLGMTVGGVSKLQDGLLMFYTSIQRDANVILKEEGDKVDKGAGELKLISDIGYEIGESLIRGDVDSFGELLNLHWETKRGISNKMSSSDIDRWYDLAMNNGAIGGKIMGAGGGGLMLFCAKEGYYDVLKDRMSAEGLINIDFTFEYNGVTTKEL